MWMASTLWNWARGRTHQEEAFTQSPYTFRLDGRGDAVEGAAVDARVCHDAALNHIDRGADGAAHQSRHEARQSVNRDPVLQGRIAQDDPLGLIVGGQLPDVDHRGALHTREPSTVEPRSTLRSIDFFHTVRKSRVLRPVPVGNQANLDKIKRSSDKLTEAACRPSAQTFPPDARIFHSRDLASFPPKIIIQRYSTTSVHPVPHNSS